MTTRLAWLVVLLSSVTALAGEVLVTQKDKAFSATELTVKTTDSVVFRNDDSVAHNVFSKDAAFNLKIQPPGDKKAVTFDKPGTYQVRCAIHPKMMLTVTVK
jgi:plastocyanin